jgi:hypothetical protein
VSFELLGRIADTDRVGRPLSLRSFPFYKERESVVVTVVGEARITAEMPATVRFFGRRGCGQPIHITTIELGKGAGEAFDNPRTGFSVS